VRARNLAAALLAAAAVIAPWTIRNLARFQEPVLISTESNLVFRGANCDATYYGDAIALWWCPCYWRIPEDIPPGDESQRAIAYRRQGLAYARHHAGRVPVVMAVRLLRVWDLYRPLQQADLQTTEGRSHTASLLGLAVYYPLLLLAVVGVVSLRRRRAPLLPLLAPVAMVSVVAAVVYGGTRLRFAAEPALVVLAAVAIDAGIARRRTGAGRAAKPSPPPRTCAPGW
jgi:hypothetical protein